ncbi:MAG: lysine--tRNA ligase [Chlamydiia bacterium]|nr:lysine--tRNA ligase [Chlamydiia bacterium]
MTLHIDKLIWEAYPHLKVGVLLLKNIDNTVVNHEIIEFLRKVEHNSKNKFGQIDLANVDKIVDWRKAYRSFGYKPSSTRSSVEALVRRTVADKQLPDINPVVNLYNAVSIQHVLPAGADDLDQVKGTLRLCVAKGDEHFVMLGQSEPEAVMPGEVIYRDDREVTTKAWNYRECDRTKITQATKNACLVIEGLEHASLSEMAHALRELRDLITRYCGGTAKAYLLDCNYPEISTASEVDSRPVPIEIPQPDYHQHEAFQTRLTKLNEIQELGIDPYPAKFEPTHSVSAIDAKYEKEAIGTFDEACAGDTDEVAVAGRIVLFRAMGTNIFAHILDETRKIQVVFNKDHTQVIGLTGELTPIKFIEKKLDLGDIIGVHGHLFRTQKGELTLFVKTCQLLCKTLLPLPDKHKGLTDKGTRYRKRWLDLITHQNVAEELRLRSRVIAGVRRYFEQHAFLEVETPILQNIYGGANARPFTSHLNALSQDMYLRIALEIALKKLLVGGINRIYEIGKVFRNEGIDRTHNPEFTMLECYAAYWDYDDVMRFTENLYETLALDIFGSTVIGERTDSKGNAHTIDLKAPWIRMTMKDAIKTYGKIDVDNLSIDEMKKHLEGKVDPDKLSDSQKGHLVAMLFEEYAEHHLIQPHHIIDHPIETTPLCKLHRDPEFRKEGLVERFESFILGMECCNAYTELNDPILQRQLLETQAKMRDAGDDEANPMDEEFLEAICQGMPPAGGLGIGIDRLCMLFTGVHSIRDILFFPVMRPEE